MKSHELKARMLHIQGNNCSQSLHTAFSNDINLSKNFPAPRSIDGKCGALLTAKKILEELGYKNKVEDFENEFIKQFGYSKCIDLVTHGCKCKDYIGKTANMLDNIIDNLS